MAFTFGSVQETKMAQTKVFTLFRPQLFNENQLGFWQDSQHKLHPKNAVKQFLFNRFYIMDTNESHFYFIKNFSRK